MDSQVEKIKDRLAINDVVGQYVQLRRAGRNFVGLCPFHKEKTPSFHVSPERGTYKCFGCGEGGDIFSFVEKIEGIDFPSALRHLAEKAGVKLESRGGAIPKNKEKEERLHEACEEAAKFFQAKLEQNAAAREYLATRGVRKETIDQWRLGYAPAEWRSLSEHLLAKGFLKEDIVDSGLAAVSEKKPGEVYDRFRGRIMFPISDATGRSIAFSGRFFEKVKGSKEEGEPAKYVNSPETLLFKKSRTLYGYDRARQYIRKADCVLLVEGQFDLVMSHQSGLPFAVALSGTALTPDHLSLLGRLSKRLVLALDADAAGVRSGLKSAMMAVAAGFDVKIPAFGSGQDPADVARENPELLKAAIRTSKTAVEFFLDVLRPQAKDERVYKQMVETQVLPLIAAMESKIEQEHFVRIVAQRIGVSDSAVFVEMSKRVPAEKRETSESEAASAETAISPFEQKIGMLLFRFGKESAAVSRLKDMVGETRIDEIEQTLIPHAELLRFRFDSEVGEGAAEEKIIAEMLAAVERMLTKEKLAGAGNDTRRIQELAKRSQELRN